eukprot:CAMPEP_0119089384 /NCGR_PEP_ID=MMETSP1178-20130426/148834_1 /TAXON_ID=33656 /ORGANISM="unid sp, Strain CCMP2000" /LENGTH=36 /DNA_ID= /DNA_START= /DNA_END= /DNA_ORIENTATION=
MTSRLLSIGPRQAARRLEASRRRATASHGSLVVERR